jgi:hypothetical protein
MRSCPPLSYATHQAENVGVPKPFARFGGSLTTEDSSTDIAAGDPIVGGL